MEALQVLNATQKVWFMPLCYSPFSCIYPLLCSYADIEIKRSAPLQANFYHITAATIAQVFNWMFSVQLAPTAFQTSVPQPHLKDFQSNNGSLTR